MEAKLAEFRKSHIQKKPLINWYDIITRLTSIFSFSSKKSSETAPENEEEREESITNWNIILIKT